jgi:Methyltransferase domain
LATRNQISYINLNKDFIKEPILIVGSKMYDYDEENIKDRIQELGLKDITGIDLFEGEGVDYKVDITDKESDFIKNNQNYFSTIIFMEVLTYVRNPFGAAENVISMLKDGGIVILSECYVRKISKMPVDLWRFTYEGTKELFNKLSFDDSKARMSLTRDKNNRLLPLSYPLPEILHGKHTEEGNAGHFLRRLHRKYFADGIFKISRLMPEITIYSTAKKQNQK